MCKNTKKKLIEFFYKRKKKTIRSALERVLNVQETHVYTND